MENLAYLAYTVARVRRRRDVRPNGEGEGEREKGGGEVDSQAHGYTALLVNTVLRKHHGRYKEATTSQSKRAPWRVREAT